MKIHLDIEGPILPGSISTAKSQCGKHNCACKGNPPELHGTYYRWTGIIDGKRTTKTISQEIARECEKRIRRYKAFQRRIENTLKEAIDDAPWNLRKKS